MNISRAGPDLPRASRIGAAHSRAAGQSVTDLDVRTDLQRNM